MRRPPITATLCLFKRRLREVGRCERFAVGESVLRRAQAARIHLGEIQVVDSVHTVADVDNDANHNRQEQGQVPRDSEAQLVKKGKHAVTQPDG